MKGNFICDEGMQFLSNALEGNTLLQEIDLSLNEIGPEGFFKIAKILYVTNINSFIFNRNQLNDDCLFELSDYLNKPDAKLKRIEFCGCKLGDKGFAKLLEALKSNKTLSYYKR